MKKFIVNILVFSILALMSFIIVFSLADGTTDALYLKFTTKPQSNMVIGSSRAAQGIIPSEISDENIIYNYAFSIENSPYGKSYYESIKRKLNRESTNGIFILCVNPWTISSMTLNPEDSLYFRERGSFIDKTYFVNFKPNMEYLLESFNGRNIDILLNKKRKGAYQTFFVHDDGWLEVTIESDMITKTKRLENKIRSYKNGLKAYSGFSKNRFHYLEKTIMLLQEHGEVFLLRLPVHDRMLTLENELMPDFDEKMLWVSRNFNINYINGMPLRNEYEYTDGNHLEISSAHKFSKYLSEIINLN